MKIAAAFLSCYNRAPLLAESLPEIRRQAHANGLDLVIVDDASSDPVAIRMLRAAEQSGIRVLWTEPHDYHAHISIQRTFVRGVRELIARHGTAAAFIKCDDDVLYAPDAFVALVDHWAELWSQGLNPAALSAMLQAERLDAIRAVTPAVWQSVRANSICCVHRLDLWAALLAELATEERTKAFLNEGWDCYFWAWCKAAVRPQFTLCPSRAFHLGHLGVHGFEGMELFNRVPPDRFAFPGEWIDGKPRAVSVEARSGKHADWLRVYSSRAAAPESWEL